MAKSEIVTANGIPLAVSVPGFHATAVSDRTADFGGHPYRVSLAALVGDTEAVMVHAETVADRSGASNYDALPAAGWPDESFRVRSLCADLPAGTVAQEHDLRYLKDNGWDPTGTLAMNQYLKTTADHNQEIVISVIVRGTRCGDAGAVKAALARLRDKVAVTRR